MITEVDDLDWNILEEEIVPPKKYVCGIDGCIKSYSNRQNCYRHRTNNHKVSTKTRPIESTAATAASLQREREFLIETFSSFYEQLGEEEAMKAMRNNKKFSEHLIPLRKIMEAEIAERLADAKESQSRVEKQLTDFKNAMPDESGEEMKAFKSVIRLVKKATPESILHLKQFVKVISTLTDHMYDYSENVNPKFKQSRVLKNVLDEMFIEEQNRMEIAPTPPRDPKRKATELAEAQNLSTAIPPVATTPTVLHIPSAPSSSAKKPKTVGYGLQDILNRFVGGSGNTEADEEALNEVDGTDDN